MGRRTKSAVEVTTVRAARHAAEIFFVQSVGYRLLQNFDRLRARQAVLPADDKIGNAVNPKLRRLQFVCTNIFAVTFTAQNVIDFRNVQPALDGNFFKTA